jgi:hypothetical protein
MTNSQINRAFIASLTPPMKTVLLSNVARHYGISYAEAEEEIIDEDAENIMDYITGTERPAFHVVYQGFIQNLK